MHERYRRYEDIASIPDRLRWRRHELGLLQKEVAAKIGVTRAVYTSLETENIDSYDPTSLYLLPRPFPILHNFLSLHILLRSRYA